MNAIRSDRNATCFEKNAGIPTRSGCLLEKLCLCLRGARKGQWFYFFPICLALAAFLWLGCPACSFALEKLNKLDYETALQKGQGSPKPLLIFFTSPWCYQCTQMERKVFQDKDIVSSLNEQFLLVEVDISEEKKLKEDFFINHTPTSLFLDIRGKPIMDIKGYIPTSRFRKLLRYVSEGHYQTTPFSEFEKK